MTLYSLFNIIATLSILFFNLWRLKEKQEILGRRSRRLLQRHRESGRGSKILADIRFYAVIEIIIISVFQYLLPGCMNRPVGELLGTGANYFGLIFAAPVFLLIACALLQVDPLRQIDLITPAYPLALAFSKIACFAADCCRGIACDFGIYSAANGQKEFPVQLLESAVALAIFIILMVKEEKFKVGTVFPVYLILYSGSRFFTEFLRVEPDVIWHLKTYHILCVIGVLVGTAEYVLMSKRKMGCRMLKCCLSCNKS